MLAGVPARPQPAPPKPPAIALLDSGDLGQWQTWTKDAGWRVIAPAVEANSPIDTRVQALDKTVREAIQSGAVDAARVYLAGRGAASAAVFYTISRVPDLWAAALALGGSAQPAIDSDRLYAANFSQVPVLWMSSDAKERPVADALQAAGIKLEFRPAESVTVAATLEWLAQHTRPEYPSRIDCETNSPTFASCYWIGLTKFDAGESNAVLPSTHVAPANQAGLDLGGFGFKTDDPGPGVLVTFLPEKYNGPLKMSDRLIALDGRDLPDARRYVELMAQVTEERAAVVTVQRGKERIRVETRIVLPRRAPLVTARVQAEFEPEMKQVLIVSRTVTEMRVTVPPQWVPAVLNWNGVPLVNVEQAGCRLLTMEKAIPKAGPCP